MQEDWIVEDYVHLLHIPGIALPSLRDLKIQFIALLKFDLFFGALVHLKEIAPGSSYIKKLKDVQTLAEVYGGVARVDIDRINTKDDEILIERFASNEDDADVPDVMLVSCLPGSDLKPVREMLSSILNRSKADPNKVGQEISRFIRERLQVERKFHTQSGKDLLIVDEMRLQKPLDYKFIKGYILVDYVSRLADFRNLPKWYKSFEFKDVDLINYLDTQFGHLGDMGATSLIYRGHSFLVSKIEEKNTYIAYLTDNLDIVSLSQLSEWILPFSQIISESWRFSSLEELRISLSIFDYVGIRGSPTPFIQKYTKIMLKAKSLKPIANNLRELPPDHPEYINEDLWKKIILLDGLVSLQSLAQEWDKPLFDIITLVEWGKERHLLQYIGS